MIGSEVFDRHLLMPRMADEGAAHHLHICGPLHGVLTALVVIGVPGGMEADQALAAGETA